jgi:hypothetical protein
LLTVVLVPPTTLTLEAPIPVNTEVNEVLRIDELVVDKDEIPKFVVPDTVTPDNLP